MTAPRRSGSTELEGHAMRHTSRILSGVIAGLTALFLAGPWATAQAQPKLKVLHSFCKKNSCTDGSDPYGGVVEDAAGNLYGTTVSGGANNGGIVYELAFDGTKYHFKRLYSFCSLSGCADGHYPSAKLIVDVNGDLYGLTEFDGANGGGTAFELVPNAARTKWTLTTLYNFCAKANCADGGPGGYGLTYQGSQHGLAYDGVSPLYGVALGGGNSSGAGVVFSLIPASGGGTASETVLYTFCPLIACPGGGFGSGALIIDDAGNLYGPASYGGTFASGVVFELSPDLTETPLYSFCTQQPDCTDGIYPRGHLAMDTNGRLWGAASQLGNEYNGGTLFRITPTGVNSKFDLLYTFCSQANCADGSTPDGGLTVGSTGTVYGLTLGGGTFGGGALFKQNGRSYSVLYNFCTKASCADGDQPNSDLIVDASSGRLFGTAIYGGSGHGGIVFEMRP